MWGCPNNAQKRGLGLAAGVCTAVLRRLVGVTASALPCGQKADDSHDEVGVVTC